jgi:tetratricopeptide (TPR) repeat protein
MIDDIAKRQFLLKHYAEAEASYRKALDILESNADSRTELKGRIAAGIWHQLGYVAQEQRQWVQAEDHYRKALAIWVELNDHYEQADTYHNLGIVAQEQRQWAQAEDYYRKALALKIEFNDRHLQASTYHQLGSVAQGQRQWAQAGDYYLKSLAIFAEYQDEYHLSVALNTLARLWKTGEAADLPGKVAAVLGWTAEEVAEVFEKLTGKQPDAGE